jgi:hypothetical protein
MAGRDVEGAPNSSNAVSRDVLVAGAGSIASGKAPAVITIDLAARGETKQAQLELSISPVKVATNEAYVIVATQVDSAETGKLVFLFSTAARRRNSAVPGRPSVNLARDEGCREDARESLNQTRAGRLGKTTRFILGADRRGEHRDRIIRRVRGGEMVGGYSVRTGAAGAPLALAALPGTATALRTSSIMARAISSSPMITVVAPCFFR